jgi:hypothetical protein
MVALAVATPAALADEHVASSGHTTATFSFERQSEYEFTHLWLTVERARAKIFDKPVETPNCNEPYCLPARVRARG